MGFNQVFEKLILRAETETCYPNIAMNSVWLNDCAFGFDGNFLCVRIKTNGDATDEDVIIKYKLTTYKFWQMPIHKVRFYSLIKKINFKIKEESIARWAEQEKIARLKNEYKLAKLLGL